jgi:hypothetical protein
VTVAVVIPAVAKAANEEQLAAIVYLPASQLTAAAVADLDTLQVDRADLAVAVVTELELITQPVQLAEAPELMDKAIAVVVEFNLVNMPPAVAVVLAQLAAMVLPVAMWEVAVVMGYLTEYLEQLIIMQVAVVEFLELVEPLAVAQAGLEEEAEVVAKAFDRDWAAKAAELMEKLDQTVPVVV